MNEASSIIQSAAHEDANIIFGAVQDEKMGDEIKITVIATGFKQIPADTMGERRERMLGEASLPEFTQPIKVQTRPKLQRRTEPAERTESPARFASEDEDEVAPPVVRGELQPEELRPVPASVFDDEFFRSTIRSVTERETEAEVVERREEVAATSVPDYDQRLQELEAREAARALEAETRLRAELAAERAVSAERAIAERSGAYQPPAQGDAEPAYTESDELDIPAFLRRSSS